MSLTTFLSKVFGNKSQRDLKAIRPIVDKINALGDEMAALTNDQLRQRIADVRADIRTATEPHTKTIDDNKVKIETLPFEERQPLWDEIDKHEKEILDIIENKLNDHLPVVFAAMRETAARFARNETIEVTATQMDQIGRAHV